MAYAMSEPIGIADRGHDHDDPEVPRSVRQRLNGTQTRNLETGERQDELRRQRDHGRLDGHGDHDTDVPDRAVQVLQQRQTIWSMKWSICYA